jgi:SAM-dependent methyltransferase
METEWEELYKEGIKPWDKGSAAPPLLDWISRNPDLLNGRILVPGCGLGHDVRAISEARPDAEPLGIDISRTALDEAEKYPTAGDETYRERDLFALPPSMESAFDWIWEHTCFCAISPARRDEFVEATHRTLKRDGQFLGVFYLDPYDDEHRPGGGPPHGTSADELEARFIGSGFFSIVEKYVPEVSYPGREGLELMLRLRKIP